MKNKSTQSKKINFKSLIPIVFLIFMGAIYFLPEFSGKRIMGSDRSQSLAINKARFEYPDKDDKIDDFVIWNPAIFSGTSAVYSGVSNLNLYNLSTSTFIDFFRSKGALIFIISLVLSYLLARNIGFSVILSILLAISITFPLNNTILYKEGHDSKIFTLVFIPIIIWGFYTLFEKKQLLKSLLLLSIGVGFSVYTRHPQMSYYLLLGFTPFLLIELIDLVRNKEYNFLMKTIGVGLVSLILGLGGNFDRLWNMKTHMDISMRGNKILKTENTLSSNSYKKKNGLDWDYAMMWSNSIPDLMTAVIPGYTGGSYDEKVSKDSDFYKKYKIERAPLYWNEYFSIAPSYLGVISIFLFFLTLVFYRSKWIIGLSLGILLTVLLSFGENLAWFQKIFFNYVPLYNKFRAPQSIMSVTTFMIPVVSMFFLYKVKDEEFKKQISKKVIYAMGGFLGFLIVATFVVPAFLTFESKIDGNLTQMGYNIFDIIEARKDFLQSDGKRSIFLIFLASSLILLFLYDKIKYPILIAGLTVLTLFDLINVNMRYYNWNLYKNEQQINALFPPRNVDKEILRLEKKREDYRVLDLSSSPFNSGSLAYYHNSVGGYSPLKHRRYQDFIENKFDKIDVKLLGMLNTKYIINSSQQSKQLNLIPNSEALGIGWFVNDVKFVETPNDELEEISNVNLKNTAVVLSGEFKNDLQELDYNISSNDYVKYLNYHPDKIEYEVNSSGKNLVVFSEMFTDNNMWRATIDGKESKIIRANYLLRGMVVPAGKHSVTFECRPESFYKGRWLSFGFGLLTLIILIINLFYQRKEQNPITN